MYTTLPGRCRPVRPIRWMLRVGDVVPSKHRMRSTSGMSRPSSAMQVATSTFRSPARKLASVAFCSS